MTLSLTPRLVQGLGTDQSLLLGLPRQAQGPGSALGHSAQPSWWHGRVPLGVRGESQGSPGLTWPHEDRMAGLTGGGEIWSVLTLSTFSCSLYPTPPLPGFSQALPSIHPSICPSLACSVPRCPEKGPSTALGNPAPRPQGKPLPDAPREFSHSERRALEAMKGFMGPLLPQSSSSDRLQPRTRHHCPPSLQAPQGQGSRLGPAAAVLISKECAANCLHIVPPWDPGSLA